MVVQLQSSLLRQRIPVSVGSIWKLEAGLTEGDAAAFDASAFLILGDRAIITAWDGSQVALADTTSWTPTSQQNDLRTLPVSWLGNGKR